MKLLRLFPVLIVISSAATSAADNVVLRTESGRFFRAAADGKLLADRICPLEKEAFEILPQGNGKIAIRAPGGRFLTGGGPGGRTAQLGPPRADPTAADVFALVPSGENRFALKAGNAPRLPILDPPAVKPGGPWTVEVYRVSELPGMLQAALEVAIRTLAADELNGKKYDKTREHKIEKFIDLPTPTLRDPKRKKREQVLGMTEQTRVEAELTGPADIRLVHMPSLKSYAEGGPTILIIELAARLPLHGHVQYKIDKLVSASTGYQAIVQFAAVSEIRVRKAEGDVVLDPPQVLDLKLNVSELKLSNDLLDVARRQIEQVVNRELRHNEEKIRTKANEAVQKAVKAKDLRVPMLGYL